jgi:integrase
MPLTELECKRATCPPERTRQRLADGQGMYLEVTPAGGKYWRLKYRLDGKEKVLALGVYPAVTLAQARKAREDARQTLSGGNDPLRVKRKIKVDQATARANTFEVVARQWWEGWRGTKTPRHADYVLRRLEADVFKKLGREPIGDLKASDFAAMARDVADRGALDIAQRLLQTSGQILRFAVARDYIERSPLTGLKPSDAELPARRKQNYARLDAKEMSKLLLSIEGYRGTPPTRLAMKLMALTFVRTGELINAPWSEFDLDKAEWRIPEERMKMRTPHIVPLSPQAVEVLRTLHVQTGRNKLLFPGERDHEKPMSNNTILKALERMGFKGRMTGHGFRGVASTQLHEMGFPHHIIELQLAHQERNAVSASYNHAMHLAERRDMMNQWAAHLDAMRGGDVSIAEPK